MFFPPIPCLFFRSCPATVARFVISIWIWEAIKRHALWSFSHIFKKVFQAEPSCANFYASTAVMPPMLGIIDITTATEHRLPTNKSRRSFAALCMSMLRVTFAFPASATLVVTGAQSTGLNRNNLSAITSALPICRSGSFQFKNEQAMKPLPGQINQIWTEHPLGSGQSRQLTSQTSTAFNSFLLKLIACGFNGFAAIANALPLRTFRMKLCSDKSAKSLSGHINKCRGMSSAFYRPMGIVWTKLFRLIQAIQTVFGRRTVTYIEQKIFKVTPTLTYRQPAMRKAIPCSVFLGSAMRGVTMLNDDWWSTADAFAFQTSTAFGGTALKAVAKNGNSATTITSTPPKSRPILVDLVETNNQQTMKFLPKKIFPSDSAFCHNNLSL